MTTGIVVARGGISWSAPDALIGRLIVEQHKLGRHAARASELFSYSPMRKLTRERLTPSWINCATVVYGR